ELAAPVTTGDCWRLVDPAGTGSMLICSFHRAGRAHAAMVSVDHTDCGAATNIMLLDAAELPRAMDLAQVHARDTGLGIMKESLAPAELGGQREDALDAGAVHDGEATPLAFEDVSDYGALVVLLRARMCALPASGKPKAPHAGAFAAPRSRKPPKRMAR